MSVGTFDHPLTVDRTDLHPFARRMWMATFIVASFLGGVVLLWLAYQVFLLFLAGVLLAIFLTTIAGWIGRLTHLHHGFSLAITGLLLLCIGGGVIWLLAAPISHQVTQLSEQLPKAVQKLEGELEQYPWGKKMLNRLEGPHGALAQTGGIIEKVEDVFSVSLTGVVDVWVMVATGIYLALRPRLYLEGFLRLVPVAKRRRVSGLLTKIGVELRRWIFGQFVSMTILGVCTWLGLVLLRIPASGLLGALAGILDFVPVAGPFIAGVASCLVALVKDPMRAVYVAAMFVSLHLLETHVIIPQVQKQATRLPPALTILALLLFYTLFGFFGLLLAVPLLALVIITTQTIYVEGIIEQPPEH